jgi:putative chitinase
VVTVVQLVAIMGCRPERAVLFVDAINVTFAEFDILSVPRMSAWCGQVGTESGGLTYTREIWGPTSWQKAYEPPSAKATELGNTRPGDGLRYRGHGLIQTTGRYNHARARDGLRKHFPDAPDFELSPELLELPRWAAASAGLYWADKGLNALADQDTIESFTALTRRVNRAMLKLDERIAYWKKGKQVFSS